MKKVLSTIGFAPRANGACAMNNTKTFKQKKFSLKLISLALALLSSSSAETYVYIEDRVYLNEIHDEAVAQRTKALQTEALQTVVKCLDSCRDNDEKKWKTDWKGILQPHWKSSSNPNLRKRLKILNLDLVNPDEQAQNALDPNLNDFVKNVVRINCLVEKKDGTFTGGIGTGTLISLLTPEERNQINFQALEQNPDLEKLEELAAFDGRVVLTCAHCLTNKPTILSNIFFHNNMEPVWLQTPDGKLELSKYNSPYSESSHKDPYERAYLSITPMDPFRNDDVFVPIIKSTDDFVTHGMYKAQEVYMQGGDVAIIILDKQVQNDGTRLEGFPLQYEQTDYYLGECRTKDTPDYGMDFVVGLGWTGDSPQELVNWKDLEMFRSTNEETLNNAEKLSRHLGWNRPKLVDLSVKCGVLRSFNINSAPKVAGEGFSGSLLVTKKGYEDQISCIAVYSSIASIKEVQEFISDVRQIVSKPM